MEIKMGKVNGWKVTAIIFIVLFILETISFSGLILWGVALVNKEYEKETECIYNVCSGAEEYIYDEYYEICECYIDGELIKSEYMK